MTQQVLTAFGFTMIAGLATGIGGLIAIFQKRTNKRFLAVSLGFSAGVMLFVSMAELYVQANTVLIRAYGEKMGMLYAILAFFGGMLVIGIIDKVIPEKENPHELHLSVDQQQKSAKRQALLRTGIFTALAVGIHNFPEGLATFVTALQAPALALPIVVAIAIHNIPEGIAVAVPVYYATGSRKKAFWYSLLSGLAEPAGALIGFLVLMPFLSEALYGVLYAAVAGIMVFISLDELLPSAEKYGEHHLSIYGLVGGMALMAVSLWLFV